MPQHTRFELLKERYKVVPTWHPSVVPVGVTTTLPSVTEDNSTSRHVGASTKEATREPEQPTTGGVEIMTSDSGGGVIT